VSGVAAAAEGIFSRRYRALSIGIVSLVALYAFEALAVATAMPTVAHALDGLSLYALAFAGTLASSVAGMVWAGRSADARGPRAPLRQGIAWFAAGLIVAGLAPTMWVLLLGRVVQGYGGGLMSVSLYVVVGRVYPPALRARLFAATAAAWVLPAVVGPAISGLIVEHAGWRWVFLSVPAVALVAAAMVLPALRGLGPLPAEERAAAAGRGRMAWAVGAAASVLLLHYAGQRHDDVAWPMLAVALAGLVACTPRLLPAGTLRGARGLPSVILLRGVAASAFFGTEVFLPLLLSRERGLSPTLAGAVLSMGALGWSTGSWLRGRMAAPRPERVLRAGLALIMLGIVGVASGVSPAVPVLVVVAGWIVAGLGMGVANPTLSVLTLELSPPAQQGANSSALQLSDALFTATVLALGGSLLAAFLERAPDAAYLGGFGVTATLALAGVLLAPRTRRIA
jgi:MFS family permease